MYVVFVCVRARVFSVSRGDERIAQAESNAAIIYVGPSA